MRNIPNILINFQRLLLAFDGVRQIRLYLLFYAQFKIRCPKIAKVTTFAAFVAKFTDNSYGLRVIVYRLLYLI